MIGTERTEDGRLKEKTNWCERKGKKRGERSFIEIGEIWNVQKGEGMKKIRERLNKINGNGKRNLCDLLGVQRCL